MARDQDKVKLLEELGYGGDLAPVDELLHEAGLSRPGKPRIAISKRKEVARLIERHFLLVCQRGDCQAAIRTGELPDDRRPALASHPKHCEVCGGGANKTAVDRMVEAMRRRGWSRLCVVGGSPNTCRELTDLVDDRIEVRIIDGVVSRSVADARRDLDWADRVVLWGGTLLDHKVSNLYKGAKVVQIAKRGIAHLAEAVTTSADQSGRAPS